MEGVPISTCITQIVSGRQAGEPKKVVMPVPELNGRHQKAVLWELAGPDVHNEPTVYNPEEISVRWEETRRESRDALGNTIIIDAAVMVAQEIPVGSIMWLGALADLPVTPTNLKQVVGYDDTPDIKNRVSQRNVMLMKFNDTLPVTVGTGS